MINFLSTSAITRVLALFSLAATMSPSSATTVFKCTVNGTVSYQSVPCPSGPSGKRPTLEQLNAAEKLKRERQASESPAKAPAPSAQPTPSTGLPAASYRCDGRLHCSQMTSCTEARYFLSHCPGVKMDGDRDGIPCEDQWCVGGAR